MRAIVLIVLLVGHLHSLAQQPAAAEILSAKQVEGLVTDSLKKAFDLRYPVYKVYKYADRSGQYYCVLTESRDSIGADKDTINRNIRAVTLKAGQEKWQKVWELNDFIIKNDNEEKTIWFWSRYIEFTDFDKDGIVEPIIVYGTDGINGSDDGRIKFLIYYKGQKVAIRHQNGTLDFERNMQIDKTFYALQQSIQLAIKRKMDMMTENNQAIFPAGWQVDMKNRKTVINEND